MESPRKRASMKSITGRAMDAYVEIVLVDLIDVGRPTHIVGRIIVVAQIIEPRRRKA